MIFYTPDSAIEYLKGKVSELFAARGVLQDAYGRALLFKQKSMGTANAVRATQLVEDLTTTLQDQNSLENKVRAVVPASWTQQLGIVPLVVGAGAVAVAGAVYLHLQRVSQHKATLALVEKGLLTPAQAIEIEKSGSLFGGGGITGLTGNIGTILMVGIAGYALFLFGPMLARSFGGRGK